MVNGQSIVPVVVGFEAKKSCVWLCFKRPTTANRTAKRATPVPDARPMYAAKTSGRQMLFGQRRFLFAAIALPKAL
jgi:hypothetical protein